MENIIIKDISLKICSSNWQRNAANKKKTIWINISKNVVYLSWPENRAYWIFDKMIKAGIKLPKIKFSNGTKTMWIDIYGIKFDKLKDYEKAKTFLHKYVT